MAAIPHQQDPGEATDGLSLREAAANYPIALRTLRTKVSRGEIRGYKVRGLRGREWRVTLRALEDVGLQPRSGRPEGTAHQGLAPAAERELAEAWRIARIERSRAAAADRELGYALMETGRLKAVVAALERRLAAPLHDAPAANPPSQGEGALAGCVALAMTDVVPGHSRVRR